MKSPKILNQFENKTILSLDLGTKMGWAIVNQYGTINSGTVNFQPNRFQGGGMRYLKFHNWLIETKNATDGIDAVYFEEVRRHVGVDASHAYGAFMGTLQKFCEQFEIPYQGVPVGTIKKYITGKGNASKQAVITGVVEATEYVPKDDNEADAIALLLSVINGGVA